MGFPIRVCIALQIFFACFMVYLIRVPVSINILAMIKTETESKSISECVTVMQPINGTEPPMKDYGNRYDWDRTEQGFVLSAYYYGYLICCIPSGYLADRFGARNVTIFATAIGAALTAVIPFGAMISVWVVVVMRFVTGLISGVVYPALQSLISRWAPPTEKGKFSAALMGNTLGTVITLPVLGLIIETIGWLWAYIIPAMIACLWTLIWYFTVADSPSEHWRITDEERDYINDSLSGAVKRVKTIPPYLKICSNIPFWALSISHFGNLWGLYLLLNNGPMYLKEALGFDIKSSGALAALPYLARLTIGFIFGTIGDYIKKKEKMSVTLIRKFFTIFSHVIPGLLLFSVLLAGCNAPFAITVIILSLGFNGASTITNIQNCQDLAPNFAGTIYGLINFFGTTTGFITPPITAYITKDRSGVKEWNIIFGIGGTVYIVSALIFFVFGTGKVQAFNEVEEEIQ